MTLLQLAFVLLVFGYLAFFAGSLDIMLEKSDNVGISIFLSLIPVFNMVYYIWAEGPKIKNSLRSIFTR